MDPTFLASVIGTALGSLLVLFLQAVYERRPLQSLTSVRRRALRGRWEGYFIQEVGKRSSPEKQPISFDLSPSLKRVKGEGFIQNSSSGIARFNLKGGFYDDRLLILEYKSSSPLVRQFGSMIFEVTGKFELRGRFLGYGQEGEDLVAGILIAHKVGDKSG
jgi:hypothetical protein